MGRYLGVDGGGTKTAFVLIDEREQVLAEETTRSLYYFSSGIDLVGEVLHEGLAAIAARTGVRPADLDGAFVALPAYGESSRDVPVLDRLVGAALGHDRYTCGNDMVAGWAGSLGGEDGISVVAGTGSIAYGEWRGAEARAGGWGEVFGDEGSAYWLAVRGLNAFSRMSDGRLPSGPLRERMREAVGAGTDLDVIGTVIDEWGAKRDRVAALSRTVTAAADDGDAVARDLVAEAGTELAALVAATRGALGVADEEEVPVSYSGGLFSSEPVLEAFGAAIEGPHRLVRPRHGPGLGAALVALRRAGGAAA